MQRRCQTMSKHFRAYKKLTANKIYWSLILVLIIAGISIGGGLLQQYTSSSKWKEAPDSKVALANQSIDMLYDKNETSRANKIKFLNLYNKIISNKGNLNTKFATPENIKKIKHYYKHFNSKGSTTNYNKMYAEVLLKYSIQEQFDNLFTDDNHSTLEGTVTPTTIVDLNNSTFNDLTTLFVQNPNDAFVEHIIKLETKLNKDIKVLNKVTSDFNNAYVFNSNTVSLRKGYTKDITSIYRTEMSSLTYDWDSTEYMQSIVTMMKPIVTWTQNQYDKYSTYIADMQNKKNAYSQWTNEKQAFFEKVTATHKAAVEAKHYQEQLARERAEAAKKAKEQKEYDSGQKAGLADGKSHNEKADLSNESSQYREGYNAGYSQGQNQAKAESESIEKARKQSENDESSEQSSSSSHSSSTSSKTNNEDSSSSNSESTQSSNSSSTTTTSSTKISESN